MSLIKQYKGDNSNYDCIKSEIENVLLELEAVDRLKVTAEFANDILEDIKKIRLTIFSITI